MRAYRFALSVAVLGIAPLGACDRGVGASPVAAEPGSPTPRTSVAREPAVPSGASTPGTPVPAPPSTGAAPPQRPAEAPPEVARPYDEQADAERDIREALRLAATEGKKVLIVFGGNWCPWCRRLEHTFRHEPRVRSALEAGFRVVHVDTGARRSGRNATINERYGNPMQHGLPVLVVLGTDGAVRMTQETGALEQGDRHDPERVLGFLARARR